MSEAAALLLFAAGLVAGAQNALAGGGSFLTLPALILTGLDARAANITSAVALFPGQLMSGLRGRPAITSAGGVPLAALIAIGLTGGAIGAGLLLATPTAVFADMVPWLILFATAMFAWSSFGPGRVALAARLGPIVFTAMQIVIAIYGGYFGGGNSFIMLAALAMTGLATRDAGLLKNLLIGVINAAAVIVFAFSSTVAWEKAALIGSGSIIGGLGGVWLLRRIDERVLRIAIVGLGLMLTVWLFASR